VGGDGTHDYLRVGVSRWRQIALQRLQRDCD
jgi:hypothetical protein